MNATVKIIAQQDIVRNKNARLQELHRQVIIAQQDIVGNKNTNNGVSNGE